ncbi:histone H1.3-like [Callorhinchus milii]|uniref:histone H1.3-like n=1 Tax=Callorhinchus milii TaxID=7868 RepID=UPI001C3FF597|nr:histone H1.3-like [Callorhinchus milii]
MADLPPGKDTAPRQRLKPTSHKAGGRLGRKPKPPGAAPTMAAQILAAVAATKERRGLSLAALKKALSANGYDVERNNARVNVAVKALVTKGSLVRTTGTGAAGSFRVAGSAPRGKRRPRTPGSGAPHQPPPPHSRRRRPALASAKKPKKGAKMKQAAATARRILHENKMSTVEVLKEEK